MHNIRINKPIQYLGYIKMKYPEIFEEADQVVKQPRLKDWTLVKPIYKELYASTENPRDNLHFFLAVLIELFDPTRRTCGVKLKTGLRDLICDAMGYNNPESVNAVGVPIEAHMKNPRFYNKVKETAEYFMMEYSNK